MEGKVVGKTMHAEIDIDSLASMQPCMSRVMRQYTERYGIMYHPCKVKNWDLGLYQLKEIREITEVGKKTRPKWKQELEDFDRKFLLPIEDAMKNKDWDAFEKAFDKSTKACNAVHKKIGYPYLKYKLPENPPDWLDITPEE